MNKKLIFILLAVSLTLSCTTISKIIYPRTSTPKATETPDLASMLSGEWTMHYSWSCSNSDYRSTTWELHEDGSFVSVENDHEGAGTWHAEGNHFHLQFNSERPAVYDGTISDNWRHMQGNMNHPDAGQGCWYADKND
jgi:hypothetical protein